MTQARSLLVPANAHGIYHCISRCVRRAWLCGRDPLSGADHEHRRQWVEDRLAQLAAVYAMSVWAYAVMSNHLHVVVEMQADSAADWGDRSCLQLRMPCNAPEAALWLILRLLHGCVNAQAGYWRLRVLALDAADC